jgi:hypothetical protein
MSDLLPAAALTAAAFYYGYYLIRPKCTSTADCPDPINERCEGGRCYSVTCDSSQQCPSKYLCERGKCISNACKRAADCRPGYLCENGECTPQNVKKCKVQSDCPDGFYCNENSYPKFCVPGKKPCEQNSDCADGFIFQDFNDLQFLLLLMLKKSKKMTKK